MVRFFVENQFGYIVCVVGSDSMIRSSLWEGGGFIVDVFFFCFFFSQIYLCNFWFGIGDGWDNFWIEVVFFIGDNFSGNVIFVNIFVCQYWLIDDIVDSKDVWYVGMQLFVNVDEIMVVNFYVCFVCVEVFIVWYMINCYQYGVVMLWFSGCFFVFYCYINVVFFCFNGGNFGFQYQVEFFVDMFGEDFNDVFVSCWDNLVEYFNYVNL